MKKVLLLTGLVLLLGFGGLFAYNQYRDHQITQNPVHHLLYSVSSKDLAEKGFIESKSHFLLDPQDPQLQKGISQFTKAPGDAAQALSRIASKFSVVSRFNIDPDKKSLLRTNGQFQLLYGEASALDMNFRFEPWSLFMHLPQVLEKPLYLNLSEEAQKYDVDLNGFDIQGYYQLLTEKDAATRDFFKKSQPYVDQITASLGPKIQDDGQKEITLQRAGAKEELKARQYRLDLSTREMYEIYLPLLRLAQKDSAAKALVLSKYDKITDKLVKDQNYNKKQFPTDEAMREEIAKTRTAIDEQWESQIEKMKNDLNQMLTDPSQTAFLNTRQTMVYSLDSKHRLRHMSQRVLLPAVSLEQEMSYFPGHTEASIEPEKVEPANTYDLSALSEDPKAAQALGESISQKALQNLTVTQAFTDLVADVRKEVKTLPEAEQNQLLSTLSLMMMFLGAPNQ